MYSNRDKHKHFDSLLRCFFHTLPLSSTSGFSSNTVLNMYNGSHTDSSTTSNGSYYNGRVINAMKASETIVAKDYIYNICPKNWTLPTYSQNSVLLKNGYQSAFTPIPYSGWRSNSGLSGTSDGAWWWTRTAYSSSSLHRLYYSNGWGMSTSGNYVYLGFSCHCVSR